MITFKEYLKEARYAFQQRYEFANKQTFEADIALEPNSPDARKIIGRQQSKVDELAWQLDITWEILLARKIDQYPAYNNYSRPRNETRPVWTYLLVGRDSDGNEITYYKYEGGTGGGSQSYVYLNRRNKTKLSRLVSPGGVQAGINQLYGQ